jgi:hypothetical protein
VKGGHQRGPWGKERERMANPSGQINALDRGVLTLRARSSSIYSYRQQGVGMGRPPA